MTAQRALSWGIALWSLAKSRGDLLHSIIDRTAASVQIVADPNRHPGHADKRARQDELLMRNIHKLFPNEISNRN
jgi:hypothetical protein